MLPMEKYAISYETLSSNAILIGEANGVSSTGTKFIYGNSSHTAQTSSYLWVASRTSAKVDDSRAE